MPASINLADLERSAGREAEAEALLRRALERVPEEASLHHALGLSLVRQRRPDEALVSLARAAELAPDNPRFAYVQGVALHSTGEGKRALEVLDAAHPAGISATPAGLTDLRAVYGGFQLGLGALALAALRPDDPDVQRLLAEIEALASQ